VRTGRKATGLILLALCSAALIINIDVTIVNVTLPSLVRELGATTTNLQWVVDAYSLVFAALILAAGSLSDRFGRKGVLLAGLGVFALGERARAIGLWGATTGVGVATGPIVGGWLLGHFWWGSVFLFMVPVAAVVATLIAFAVPTSRDPSVPRIDVGSCCRARGWAR
jgi:MFS family permease